MKCLGPPTKNKYLVNARVCLQVDKQTYIHLDLWQQVNGYVCTYQQIVMKKIIEDETKQNGLEIKSPREVSSEEVNKTQPLKICLGN